jgi:hypothetical protein
VAKSSEAASRRPQQNQPAGKLNQFLQIKPAFDSNIIIYYIVRLRAARRALCCLRSRGLKKISDGA